MPLDSCIDKVGTLSESDIAFLRQEILDGKTDEQAIANLEILIESEASELVTRIEAAGGTVKREAPPVLIDMGDAATAASLENNMQMADQGSYKTNRELKEAMQANVLQEGIDLTERTEENAAHLAAVGTADAIFALQDNADAVGWYDKTVTKALEILGTIHPEILEDSNARFAFTYALAVTSNGMKVDNNFKMAEKAYSAYKKDGKMPNNVGEGQASAAINEHMDLFNELVEEYGLENLGQVFNSQFTVGQMKMLEMDPGGELVDTQVYGAAVLGPKIGNGFFMNLNGQFDQLTMDRWLMRTWGRWTGSLIANRPDLVEAKTKEMHKLLTRMAKAKKSWEFFQKTIDMDLTNHGQPGGPTHAEIAQRIQKVSVSPDSRSDMNRTVTGDLLRKLGNGLAKDIDGQKEAPQHGTERVWIRKVFATILDNMHAQGYTEMTMADLQALLWYPEKRLYDKAKSSEDVANGYDLDEAPDYANAAAGLAAKQGVKPAEIKAAIQRAEQQHENQVSAGRAARELPAQAAEGQPPAGRGLARKERGKFLRRNILVPNRVSRSGNAKAKSYTNPSRGTLGNVRGLIHKPRQDFAKQLVAAEVTPMTMVEMESTPDNAILFAQAIQNIKDAHPEGAAVYVYPFKQTDHGGGYVEAGYEDMKLFVNEDQTAGFAVKEDGDIVSVFATPNRDQPGRVYSMLSLAVERAGGTKLDAFDTVLPVIYGMAGFTETGRESWNEDHKPPDWDKATFSEYNNGEPDIVYMEYQAAHVPKYFAQSGTTKEEAMIEIDDALADGTIKLTQAEAEAFAAMGYTHPDVRRTENDAIAEAAARSPADAAKAREDYARATNRTDAEVSAEFARAKRGETVTFLHRSEVEFSHFDDGYLGGNTGRPTAHLGHFLTAMSYDAPEFGDNLVTVTFQFKKPLVISSDEFVAMGDRSIAQNKQDRADLLAQGYDGILIDGLEWAIALEGKGLVLEQDKSGNDWLMAKLETDYMSQAAFHGSPHRFDRFDHSKMGSGEGAQAYGWGTYLAESEDVAKTYKAAHPMDFNNMNPSREVLVDGKQLRDQDPETGISGWAANLVVETGSVDGAIEWYQNYIDDQNQERWDYTYDQAIEFAGFEEKDVQMVRSIKRMDVSPEAEAQLFKDLGISVMGVTAERAEEVARAKADKMLERDGYKISEAEIADLEKARGRKITQTDPGHLYKVEVDDKKVAAMLDWDKPVDQQTPEIQKALASLPGGEIWEDSYGYPLVGAELYEKIKARVTGLANREAVAAAGIDTSKGFAGGQDELTSKYLGSLGIPGIRFLDANSRSDRFGTSNFVVFEESDITVTHRDGEAVSQEQRDEALGIDVLEQPDRARFYPDIGGKRVIQLLETSDLSSFLHESGHLFLDIQRIWADKYGMNENQHAILEWLGLDNFEEITTEQHEQWAETFEVYLREGKAPSVGLRRAFASFASWLKRIYRSLSSERLQRARLDPEVTEIFDRMLATQSEIDLAKLQPEYSELFQSQEQAGMTDAQWEKYKKNATKKNETAEATIDAKVMKEYKHQKSEQWAREKEPLIQAAADRLAKDPVYQVLSDMTVIKDDNGEVVADGRVDWHALRDAIGGWPNGKNWIGKAVGGGLDPALYAEAHGFSSVKDMYEQVKNSDTLKQASEKAAEQIMVQKYGDILNDGTLEQEVREAMLNEEQAAMVLAELKAEGNPKAQKIDRATLKYQAEQLLGTYVYKKIRPTKFYNQMIKAAQAAAKATDPTLDKIQQLANHYLYKAAVEAKDKMDKGRKKVRSVQARIAAGKIKPSQVDQQYIEAMAALANAYDMRLTPVERQAHARRVLDFYEGQTNPNNENSELFGLEMLDPNLIAAIRYRHDNGSLEGFEISTFDEMTVSEMRGVTDMLDHLRYVGGQIANKGAAEAAAIREAGLESIEENGGSDSTVQRGKTRKGKMAKLTWGDMVNSIPSLGNMVRKLDGFKEGGWAFENIYKPINDAMSRKYELQMEMFAEMEAFMADMSRVGLRENDAMPFRKEDGTEDDFTSSEVFMMAVYWGTESSRTALMQGHGLSELDVQNLMQRLTPRQLNLVNNVWAMNESQWPQLQEAAKAMLGIAPPKLEATPFEINGVQMTGGHMQLMYDSQALELADEQMRGMNTTNVVPMQAGSTHSRVGSGGRPVLLDTRNITQSVEEKTHYIAFAQVGRHLRGILNNKEIQNKIEKKHGAPFYENMLHAITSISRAEPARETSRWLARLSRHMRGAATMMHLAYSIRNVAQQFSAIPIAAREVGVLKWAQAMGHFGSRPLEVMSMVDAKSKFMENRKQVVNREAKEYMKKVMATSKGEAMWNEVKARGFILQTLVDSTVAYPTWYARYTSAMENHGDEKRAVIEADQSVAESVGSGSDMHLGRIMQSNQNEFVKTLTVFGSWFNAYYQRLYKSSKGGTNFLSAAFLMDGLLMPIIAANLAQVLIMDIPDEDEEVEEWAAKNTLKFMLGTVPLIRDIASAWEGFAPTMPISAVAVAPVRMKTEIESYMKGNQSGIKLAADIGRAAGSVIPMPGSGNIWRFLDYTDSFLEGNEGKNFNIYQALAEGRDKN